MRDEGRESVVGHDLVHSLTHSTRVVCVQSVYLMGEREGGGREGGGREGEREGGRREGGGREGEGGREREGGGREGERGREGEGIKICPT